MQIAIDQPFPTFSLPAIDPEGNQMTQSNESLLGKKWVLFVYPKDQTPGCTVEACSFRDLSAEFGKVGVEVYGLSRDNIRAHANFIKKQELTYTLIADAGGEWLKQNDFIIDAKMYGKPVTKVLRTTFFIDQKGLVKQVWESVTPLDHATQVLEWIKANA